MSDDLFAELRRRLDTHQVAAHLGLKTRNRGDYFECPDPNCPSRKKGRLTARSAGHDTWTCQACEAKGDSIDLIEIVKGVSTGDAVKEAKALAGIEDDPSVSQPLPPRPPPPPEHKIAPDELRDRQRAWSIATDHYARLRMEDAEYLRTLDIGDRDYDLTNRRLRIARTYVQARGFAPLKDHPVPIGVCPHWRTGLAERLAAEFGSFEIGFRAGLLGGKDSARGFFERYRGRLWLPWRDTQGVTWAAKGRAIPELAEACGLGRDGAIDLHMLFPRTSRTGSKPPHVYKPEVPFGWRVSRDMLEGGGERRVVIVEGELDALSAIVAGVPAVATGGTSGVDPDTLFDLLRTYNPLIVFDGDELDNGKRPGRDGAMRLSQKTGFKWTTMLKGDLNDVLQRDGIGGVATALREAYHRALEPIEKLKSKPPEVGPTDWQFGMPAGYRLRTDGTLCQVTVTEDGNEEWVPLGLRDPPEIIWRGYDVGHERSVLGLRVTPIGRESFEVKVDREVLKSTREIVGALAGHDVDVDSTTARSMVQFLSAQERHTADRLPAVAGSKQMGWHLKKLLDKTDFRASFLYGLDSYGEERLTYLGAEPEVCKALRCEGTPTAWRDGVLRVLERYPKALFGLYVALAAPIIEWVPDMTGFAVEYAGLSSHGKSTTSKAIASAFGDSGENGGLLRPPYDTANALELHAQTMNHLPLFLEDHHLMDRVQARNLVMNWVNGLAKGRSARSGTRRQPTRRWATTAILTGEAPIADTTTYLGVGARVISLGTPIPVYEQADMRESVVDDIARLSETRMHHFGHAGRQWIEWLANGHVGYVIERYREYTGTLARLAKTDGPSQRLARFCALAAAVAEVAAPVIGGADGSETDVLEVAVQFLGGRKPADQVHDALEFLLSQVAIDLASGAHGDEDGYRDHQRQVWYRYMSDGTLMVARVRADAILKQQDYSLTMLEKEWLARGYLGYRGINTESHKCRLGSGSARCLPFNPVTTPGLGETVPRETSESPPPLEDRWNTGTSGPH